MTSLSGAYRRRTGVQVVVSGARGPSDYELWVREGNTGTYGDYLAYLAALVIANAPGFKGDKGDPGGNAAAIGLFTQAATLSIPAGYDLVRTSGYASIGVGKADYQYDPAVDAAYVSANPRSSFRTTNGRGYRLVTEGGVRVTQLGARSDGSDAYPAFQAACNLSLLVWVPQGDFPLSQPVQVRAAQVIRGEVSDFAVGAYVHNDNVGGGCFWYTQNKDTVDVKAPEFYTMRLVADFPIRLNDENTSVIADAGGNCPPLVRWRVEGCEIYARSRGVGRGIAVTKGFDGIAQFNRIVFFHTSVLVNCCDLNEVAHNRLYYADMYNVLEVGTSSFSSQNEIHHNDMLYVQNSNGYHVKSTARHSRVTDNYLEQGNPCRSFIDLSEVDMPRFVDQPAGAQYTAVVRDNRIDGHVWATQGVHRLQVTDRYYAEIHDVGTSGEPATSPTLVLCDAQGNNLDELPVRNSQFNAVSFDFKGPGFGNWDGYRTRNGPPDLSITGENIGQFGANLFANGALNFLRARPGRIVLKNGFNSVARLLYPNGFLSPGNDYTFEWMARCTAGTETLKIGYVNGPGGSALTDYPLTTEWRRIFTNVPAAAADSGPYFGRSNNGADIEIRSIKGKRLYDKSVPLTVADSFQFVPDQTVGEIAVFATESSFNAAVAVNKLYRFANGKLILLGSDVPAPEALNVNLAYVGGVITVSLTGTASGKRASLGHNYDGL